MTGKSIAAAAISLLALSVAFVPAPAFAARTDASIGMQLEPPNLDPTGGAAAAIDEVVYANLFEGLTRFGSDGAVLPALAESWDISEDGLVYTFHLHTGVKFHDGSAFDAEDVKFSLDRARADESTNAQKALFADIASVEVVDPATVKVTLSKPNGSFLFNMAWGDAVIVAPETAADNASKPVGTGPFSFGQWVKGDRVELERNPDYWGEPVKLEKVTFKFISDPTAAFAAMMAGDLDAYPAFPAPENLSQFAADPRFEVIIGSTEGETILAMNNKKPPLDNIKVRQAIAHAIDRQAIIDGALFGYGTPIGTHFAPHNPAYVDLTAQSAYDPEQSKALLAEAGVSDLTLSLKLPPPSYARRGGEIIAAQLREVGINTEITNVEWAQWLEDVFKGKNFDLTIVSHTEPMDIGIYARDDYYFQYGDPDFKAIMADLANATDPDKRTELLQAAQKKIADDYVNAYLFQLARAGVANAKLKGLWTNSPTPANDMTGVYWEE
ncbi:ABC transporter substrate-binding protein [Hoeflea olei]|uniref:ABC transporter substrate-binding protein n=1 Tax=Hoeflea olei TaxID=1480615 RepID=A0A1C1YRU0_9HYPH|nr:ABC transporter substrate-binding protein [Hoeflea olei]OCW56090.1 ABC transporter substrate-binding protein [Hoeflea olei]